MRVDIKNYCSKVLSILAIVTMLFTFSESDAATTGSVNLTGTVTQVLDLTVDQSGYTTAFTNAQLVSGMSSSYQDVAKLLVNANNYYTITLDNLYFTSSELGAVDIPVVAKLAPKGSSPVTGTTSGSSVVFTINDQNDGTSGNGDVISVTTNGDSEAVGGNWSATISVTLAAQ